VSVANVGPAAGAGFAALAIAESEARPARPAARAAKLGPWSCSASVGRGEVGDKLGDELGDEPCDELVKSESASDNSESDGR
jgi:hypothetical protein